VPDSRYIVVRVVRIFPVAYGMIQNQAQPPSKLSMQGYGGDVA
jgi:hypothetical protein